MDDNISNEKSNKKTGTQSLKIKKQTPKSFTSKTAL